MSERKVGRNRDNKPVLPDLRLPDAHYAPGDTAEVTVDGATVTIRPTAKPLDLRVSVPAADGLDWPA